MHRFAEVPKKKIRGEGSIKTRLSMKFFGLKMMTVLGHELSQMITGHTLQRFADEDDRIGCGMTWAWELPIRVIQNQLLTSPLVCPHRTRAIIPTFHDWDGARETIESLLECSPRVGEVVLVNDNVEPDPPAWVDRYPVHVVNYRANRGPSHARNAGAMLDTGMRPEWFYFTDSGCTRDRNFFSILAGVRASLPSDCVAIGGPVSGVYQSRVCTPINHYMTEEAILNPPANQDGPQSIVTANALVSACAFRMTGGFDTSYPFAAGEDLDLGLRLRRYGRIGWASEAIVYHEFVESHDDFWRRFVRYGGGTAHLAHRFGVPSLRPEFWLARNADMQELANIQIRAMQQGYDEQCRKLAESVRRRA